MEKYSELSYRDIQARAKELGIPANKKREVLIEAILEAEQASATEAVVIDQEVVHDAAVTPEMNDTIQSSVSVEETTVEPEVQSTAIVSEVENVLDQSLEYFDSYPEAPEEEEDEYHECDTGDLIDAFEGMQLKGIPNPEGIKTVFTEEDVSGVAPKIDWGIDFANETENGDWNFVNKLPEPCGKHTVFSSPDLQMGKGVHWNYEDFDKTAVKKQQVTLSAPPSSVTKTVGPMTPGKNMSNEDRMQFWLAKGPKTPIR